MSTDNSESMMKLDPNDLESLNGGITIGNRDRNACPYCGSKEFTSKKKDRALNKYCAKCGQLVYSRPVVPPGPGNDKRA